MKYMRIYCTDGTYCDYFPATKIEDLERFK